VSCFYEAKLNSGRVILWVLILSLEVRFRKRQKYKSIVTGAHHITACNHQNYIIWQPNSPYQYGRPMHYVSIQPMSLELDCLSFIDIFSSTERLRKTQGVVRRLPLSEVVVWKWDVATLYASLATALDGAIAERNVLSLR
jgi:hypothetical protein